MKIKNTILISARLLLVVFFATAMTLVPLRGVDASSSSNPRPDRPGVPYLLADGDLNTQYNLRDLLPAMNGLNIIQVVNNYYYLTAQGDVWYINENNELTQKPDISNVRSLTSLGILFAIKNDGTVWSWGCDSYLLGRDNNGSCTTPGQVLGLHNIKKIAGESSIFALSSTGELWGWGDNTGGAVGIDPSVSENNPGVNLRYPVQVTLPQPATDISSARNYTMATMQNGDVYSWGQLGPNGPKSLFALQPTPVKIDSISNARSVYCGNWTAFVVRQDGSTLGWGVNISEQLLLNSSDLVYDSGIDYYYAPTPATIQGIPQASEISGQAEQDVGGLIVRSYDDELWVWGHNRLMPTVIPNTQNAGSYVYDNGGPISFVKPSGLVLSSLSAQPSPATVQRGSGQQLTITGHYSDSSTQDLTSQVEYVSNNPAVASVSNQGLVSGIAVGSATITASYFGNMVDIPVTVNPLAPQPPTNLSLVNGSGAGRLNLSWSAPSDNGGSAITNYLVFRKTGSNAFAQIASTTATSFSDNGLTTGTAYEYYVKAVNSVGQSNPSTTVSKQAPGILGNPICILGICI